VKLDAMQQDRAAGVLLGQACGDALGVPYEFKARLRDDELPTMKGGGLGPYDPGEYSDDTQMAVCIAEVAATGADVRTPDALDAIAERFLDWRARGASDIGLQTSSVLGASRDGEGRPAERMRAASLALHERTGKTAGNGALMRTGPVALAHLGDDDALAEAARAVAELTHADPLAGDSCVLWCIAIDRAVRERRLDGVYDGLPLLPAARREQWRAWLEEAERQPPSAFNPNGFTVRALQAAWSAISRTDLPPADPAVGSFACLHLQHALDAAVRAGDDTDTVAAIAGALLGARWGASAVPFGWRRIICGWPNHRAGTLVRLAIKAAGQATSEWPDAPTMDNSRWVPAPVPVVPHPHDPGVLLGTASATGTEDVDAVVSLCRMGRDEVPRDGVRPEDHLEYWLIDNDHSNADPAFVIDDAARAVAALRDEGRTVLLHCVRAEMRTPAVAARYATLRGVTTEQALQDVRAALPHARAGGSLHEAVRSLEEAR
jgi:ADP-ribosylglycohydrolase